MKTYYFIATFLICNILFGCSYHCKRELESFRQKNRDWAVVGVWEAIPEEDEELSEMKLAVEIYNSDGCFHIAQSREEMDMKFPSMSGVWYTENNIIYRNRCKDYGIQNLGNPHYKIEKDTLFLRQEENKNWVKFIRYK